MPRIYTNLIAKWAYCMSKIPGHSEIHTGELRVSTRAIGYLSGRGHSKT